MLNLLAPNTMFFSLPRKINRLFPWGCTTQNSVESYYAGSIYTSTLQIPNNKETVAKGITGMLSKYFQQMCEKIRTEVAMTAKTKESQYGLLFADYWIKKISRSTKSGQGSSDAILTYTHIKILLVVIQLSEITWVIWPTCNIILILVEVDI